MSINRYLTHFKLLHTFVSVIMPSKGQEYTAIFASLTEVTSPSVSFLKTMPCSTEEAEIPAPWKERNGMTQSCIIDHLLSESCTTLYEKQSLHWFECSNLSFHCSPKKQDLSWFRNIKHCLTCSHFKIGGQAYGLWHSFCCSTYYIFISREKTQGNSQ